MISRQAEKQLRDWKPCAFCGWATHAYPHDDEHERLHMEGWHTCGLDGVFRRYCPDCDMFLLSGGVVASF